MNVHDSRRIEEVLDRAGYGPAAEPGQADVIVLNTCSVREKAENKLLSELGRLRALKAERPDLVLAVAGCVAQQEGDRLLRRVKYLDLVLGPDNIAELPELIAHVRDGGPPMARTVFDHEEPTFLRAQPRRDRPEISSFVTVMKGCDERCTYCIVPYTRGSERYRPSDDIVGEIAQLVAGGVKEITLLGQTVNSWHPPSTDTADKDPQSRSSAAADESQFAELLFRIAEEVPDLLRLRYTSPHPRHLTDALFRAHAELDVLAKHVHLPVQSGSNRMLKRMLRRYTREHYIERVKALQQVGEGITLSTDIIVGFPGETEADFQETMSLVEEVGFVAAFAFKYSERPYTPALKLGDDVDEATKSRRLAELFERVNLQQHAHLQTLVGTTQRVLFEKHNDPSVSRFSGRTHRNEIVHVNFPQGSYPLGAEIEVEIEQAYKHSLRGRPVGEYVLPDAGQSLRSRVRLPLAS